MLQSTCLLVCIWCSILPVPVPPLWISNPVMFLVANASYPEQKGSVMHVDPESGGQNVISEKDKMVDPLGITLRANGNKWEIFVADRSTKKSCTDMEVRRIRTF